MSTMVLYIMLVRLSATTPAIAFPVQSGEIQHEWLRQARAWAERSRIEVGNNVMVSCSEVAR
jgi:hypothetical protein